MAGEPSEGYNDAGAPGTSDYGTEKLVGTEKERKKWGRVWRFLG